MSERESNNDRKEKERRERTKQTRLKTRETIKDKTGQGAERRKERKDGRESALAVPSLCIDNIIS